MNHCDEKDDCAVAEKFERSMAELTRNIEVLSRKLDELNHHITGNGTPEHGMLIRIDRIEQRMGSQSKWIGVAVSAAATAAGAFIVQLVMFLLKNQ